MQLRGLVICSARLGGRLCGPIRSLRVSIRYGVCTRILIHLRGISNVACSTISSGWAATEGRLTVRKS